MSTQLPRSHDELAASLRGTDLPEDAIARLLEQARSALLLTTEAAGDDLPLGASRLGGAPDLPPGMAWPERPAYPDATERAGRRRSDAERTLAESKKRGSWMTPEQGERFSQEGFARADAIERTFPLAFFGQFDLEELSRTDGFDDALPRQGRLLVFYDFWEQPEDFTPEASVGWRVIWDASPAAELVRAVVPAELSDISDQDWSTVFRPARLHATRIVTPMPPGDENWDAFDLDDEDLRDTYWEWYLDLGTPDLQGAENHQLGGYPRTLQNGLQAYSHLSSNGVFCGTREAWQTEEAQALLPGAKEWRLLLQIGVDGNAGFDGPGAYYVIIRDEDLAARRFERARVTYQCD